MDRDLLEPGPGPGAAGAPHLDGASWRALLSAERPDPALVEHLAAGCEACEAFLATRSDPLDGEVDRALLSVGPAREAPLDELAWRRFTRRQQAPALRRRRLVVGLALAAGLLVSLGVSLNRPGRDAGWNGLKRSESMGPSLRLSAARRQSDQAFVRLDEGARVAPGSVLVLRATSSVDGPARVFLERAGQAPVEVGQSALKAGTHELLTDTGLLGVSLDSEQGAVRVWVVVGEGPFGTDSALQAIRGQGAPELAAASVLVRVE
jgi:hypothetical protein